MSTLVQIAHPSPLIVTPARPARIDEAARHIVFLPTRPPGGGGGGGGGNRQAGPIRRAEGVGTDTVTLRIARRQVVTAPAPPSPDAALPSVVLDAMPLASGAFDHLGLPAGGVSFGASTGAGSGGGVGDGLGTGIGSGRGPGVGPGSGGGIGGGVYRPGGAVTAPRIVAEIKPAYTPDALLKKIQGSVVVELVVRANGLPANIHVVRSLDPDGLDEAAMTAAGQWRFEPGRRAGMPVDVLVTIVFDFTIR